MFSLWTCYFAKIKNGFCYMLLENSLTYNFFVISPVSLSSCRKLSIIIYNKYVQALMHVNSCAEESQTTKMYYNVNIVREKKGWVDGGISSTRYTCFSVRKCIESCLHLLFFNRAYLLAQNKCLYMYIEISQNILGYSYLSHGFFFRLIKLWIEGFVILNSLEWKFLGCTMFVLI